MKSRQKFWIGGAAFFAGLWILCLALFVACPMETGDGGNGEHDDDPGMPLDSLEGTWWETEGGETLFFAGATRVGDGDNKYYDYSYDGASKSGAADTLGPFAVGADAESLSFPDYRGSGTAALFRLREAPAPPEPEGPLAGTLWKFNDHILQFGTGGAASLGNAAYAYTYREAERQGNIPGLGDFVIAEDYTTLEFSNYMESGLRRVFNNTAGAALAGTRWAWGCAVLEFKFMGQAKIRSQAYSYAYDEAAKRGVLTGPDIITVSPGEFSIDEESGALTFADYKGCGCPLEFDALPAGASAPAKTLVGSAWIWGSRIIEFMTEEGSLMTKPLDPGFVFYDQVILSGPLAGWMEYCGNFEVSPDFKTLNFPLYGPYPHGALFTPYE